MLGGLGLDEENIDVHHKLAANQLMSILNQLGQKADDEKAKNQMLFLIDYFASISGNTKAFFSGKELKVEYIIPLTGNAYSIPKDDLSTWRNSDLFHVMCRLMAAAGITPRQAKEVPDLYAMAKARRERRE